MYKELNYNKYTIPKKNKILKSFLEKINRPFDLKNNINYIIYEVFFELKAIVYFTKVIRKLLAFWKMVVKKRPEQEALFIIRGNALGIY